MTIQSAADLYGISKQAIYQRLKSKGYDIKQLKTKSGDLTEEAERILEELFDRTSVTGEGEQTRQERKKAEDNSLLQAQKKIESLTAEVDSLRRESTYLTREVESLREERDYLRRALDQSQQLQAMTMKQMLPPAPAERQGIFSWLASRFKKPAAADQQQTENNV